MTLLEIKVRHDQQAEEKQWVDDVQGFFVLGHDRRRILHFNVTRHPTSAWIVQQLRETFPYAPSAKFLLLDHDSKYGTEVPVVIRAMGIMAVRTAVGCPWQKGVAERWVGSCRRELLNHVIASTNRI